jgi:hypothetical protein
VHGRVKVLGQPLTPLLTVLPLGILGSAVLLDLAALIADSQLFGMIAHTDMAMGLLLGVASLCVILVDLVTAPAGPEREALSVVAALTGSMMAVFMVFWSVRAEGDRVASGGGLLLEILALVAGALGASLVRRLALGHGLPEGYRLAGAAAGRYVAEGSRYLAVGGRYVVANSRHLAENSGRYLVESGRYLAENSGRAIEAVRAAAPSLTKPRR